MCIRDSLKLGVSPEKAPDKPTYVTIGFEAGEPVSVDGVKMDPRPLVEKLNELGGANGVGIADICEDRLVGMKSRGVYETPGGTILYAALQELEYLCLDVYKRQTLLFTPGIIPSLPERALIFSPGASTIMLIIAIFLLLYGIPIRPTIYSAYSCSMPFIFSVELRSSTIIPIKAILVSIIFSRQLLI